MIIQSYILLRPVIQCKKGELRKENFSQSGLQSQNTNKNATTYYM